MKFQVTMKDPDTLHDACFNAAVQSLQASGLSKRELELVVEERSRTYQEIAGRWFDCGEYLTVEIDTEAKTCTVVPK